MNTGKRVWKWQGYDEALLLYLLGLGSPTHPLSEQSYAAWTSTYLWQKGARMRRNLVFGPPICIIMLIEEFGRLGEEHSGIAGRFVDE